MASETTFYSWIQTVKGNFSMKQPSYGSFKQTLDFDATTVKRAAGTITVAEDTPVQIDLSDLADECGPAYFKNTGTVSTAFVCISVDNGTTCHQAIEIPPGAYIPIPKAPDYWAATDSSGGISGGGCIFLTADNFTTGTGTTEVSYEILGGATA